MLIINRSILPMPLKIHMLRSLPLCGLMRPGRVSSTSRRRECFQWSSEGLDWWSIDDYVGLEWLVLRGRSSACRYLSLSCVLLCCLVVQYCKHSVANALSKL